MKYRAWRAALVIVALVASTPAASAWSRAPRFGEMLSYRLGSESQQLGNEYSDPSSTGIGDFNGDGRRDLAVASEGKTTESRHRADFKLYVLPGQADGTLGAPSQVLPITAVGSHPAVPLAVGDFDRRLGPDVIVGTPLGLNVYLQSAAGLLPPVVVPTNGDVLHVIADDLEGDGSMDVVAATTTEVMYFKSFQEYIPPTAGGFTAPPRPAWLGSADAIAVGDVMGSGIPIEEIVIVDDARLLVLEAVDEQVVYKLHATTFAAPVVYSPVMRNPSDTLSSAAVGDVTGDGYKDVVATVNAPGNDALINVFPRLQEEQIPAGSNRTLDEPRAYEIPGPAPEVVQLADPDDDGIVDGVFVLREGAVSVVLPRVDGGLTPQCSELIPPAERVKAALTIGRLDDDDLIDVVVAAGAAEGVVVLPGVPPSEEPPSVTMNAATPATVSRSLRLEGVLDLGGACPTAGQVVQLHRVNGDGTQQVVATAETDLVGRFSFVVVPDKAGTVRYRAVWREAPDVFETSSIVQLTVSKLVTSVGARLSGHRKIKDGVRIYRGGKAVFTATVRPRERGNSVVITVDALSGGSWRRVRTVGVPTDRHGRAVTRYRGEPGKTYRIQARVLEDDNGLKSTSRTLKFRFARA